MHSYLEACIYMYSFQKIRIFSKIFFHCKGFDQSDDISWSPLPLSESCDEADDEFECDCEHCSLLRHRNSSVDVIDLTDVDPEHEALRQQRRDEMIFGAENETL